MYTTSPMHHISYQYAAALRFVYVLITLAFLFEIGRIYISMFIFRERSFVSGFSQTFIQPPHKNTISHDIQKHFIISNRKVESNLLPGKMCFE